MPVTCPIRFKRPTNAEFHALDYQVMAHAFACHSELGRLCDEDIYKTDLAARLISAGLGPVRTEVAVVVSWQTFRKNYYLDLTVNDCVVYDLKAAIALIGEHEAQLLNYLLLNELPHGKLLNFRPPSLQWRFVSTTLTLEARCAFRMQDKSWREITPSCTKLREVLLQLLADWGAFLEVSLYEEALTWFLGGEAQVKQRVKLARKGVSLGTQTMLVLAPGVAFKLTAATEHREQTEGHLRRFLALTNLEALQWINLRHSQIEFTTLFRSGASAQ